MTESSRRNETNRSQEIEKVQQIVDILEKKRQRRKSQLNRYEDNLQNFEQQYFNHQKQFGNISRGYSSFRSGTPAPTDMKATDQVFSLSSMSSTAQLKCNEESFVSLAQTFPEVKVQTSGPNTQIIIPSYKTPRLFEQLYELPYHPKMQNTQGAQPSRRSSHSHR